MEDTPPVITAPDPNTAAAPPPADVTSQPNLDNLSLEQLDELLTTGKVEIPASGGEGTVQDEPAPPAAKVEGEPVVETPVVTETPPAKVEDEVVVESRTPEEIEADVTAAVAAVTEAGGDEAAQLTAAEEARAPKPAASLEPPVKTQEELDAEAEVQRIHRPRLKDPVDQEIAAVFKAAESLAERGLGEKITWAEAERRVKGDPPAKVEAPEVEQQPDLVQTVATLEGEVNSIKTKLDEASQGESLFTPEISKLTQELAEKQADLRLAKFELTNATKAAETAAQTAAAASEANRQKAMATARTEYPDVANKTTPLGIAVAKRVAELKNPNHPDHDLLRTDSCPLTIVRDVAAELGILPKKVAAAPPAKPKVVAPPRQVVSPPSGGKTSVPAVQPEAGVKKIVDHLKSEDATLEELDAAQGAGDPNLLLAVATR
jgi:hypothetical protein